MATVSVYEQLRIDVEAKRAAAASYVQKCDDFLIALKTITAPGLPFDLLPTAAEHPNAPATPEPRRTRAVRIPPVKATAQTPAKAAAKTPKKISGDVPPLSATAEIKRAILAYLYKQATTWTDADNRVEAVRVDGADGGQIRAAVAKALKLKADNLTFRQNVANAMTDLKNAGYLTRAGMWWTLTDAGRVHAKTTTA